MLVVKKGRFEEQQLLLGHDDDDDDDDDDDNDDTMVSCVILKWNYTQETRLTPSVSRHPISLYTWQALVKSKNQNRSIPLLTSLLALHCVEMRRTIVYLLN